LKTTLFTSTTSSPVKFKQPDPLSLSQKQSVQPARTPFHFHFNPQPHFDLPLCLEGESQDSNGLKQPPNTASLPSTRQSPTKEESASIPAPRQTILPFHPQISLRYIELLAGFDLPPATKFRIAGGS
jgi:hypothetical protein